MGSVVRSLDSVFKVNDVELKNVVDVTATISSKTADTSTRDSPYESFVTTLKSVSFDVKMLVVEGGDALQMYTYWYTGQQINVTFFSYGTPLSLECIVTEYSTPEVLADSVFANVKIQPTYAETGPGDNVIGGGQTVQSGGGTVGL